ncbi:MAG: hypothetical protein AAF495_22645 [Pseudomonadota bacterium]
MPGEAREPLDYRETLLLFYEEEIEGEAYFAALAERHDGHPKEALILLARVETAVAAIVAPLLGRHGLVAKDRAALHACGRAQADAKNGVSWPELVAEMTRDFRVFVEEFEALERLAPPNDRERLRILTEHETAAIAFLELEAAGDPASLAPLERYLTRYGADDRAGPTRLTEPAT